MSDARKEACNIFKAYIRAKLSRLEKGGEAYSDHAQKLSYRRGVEDAKRVLLLGLDSLVDDEEESYSSFPDYL